MIKKIKTNYGLELSNNLYFSVGIVETDYSMLVDLQYNNKVKSKNDAIKFGLYRLHQKTRGYNDLVYK